MTLPRVPDTTLDRCHCGREMEGSDHCPFCGCEVYERYCNAHYASGKHPDRTWTPHPFAQFRTY